MDALPVTCGRRKSLETSSTAPARPSPRSKRAASTPTCPSPLSASAGRFGDQDFPDDAAAAVDHFPGGAVLRFLSQREVIHRRIDWAPAAPCVACALCSQGTTSLRGRRISCSLDEAYLDEASLDRVRSDATTEASAKAVRKRQVWGEPLVAEAKDWHALRRFRLRGREKVNGEALPIAAGQNRKRLLSR